VTIDPARPARQPSHFLSPPQDRSHAPLYCIGIFTVSSAALTLVYIDSHLSIPYSYSYPMRVHLALLALSSVLNVIAFKPPRLSFLHTSATSISMARYPIPISSDRSISSTNRVGKSSPPLTSEESQNLRLLCRMIIATDKITGEHAFIDYQISEFIQENKIQVEAIC
jgi:hypothetical protein